LPKLQGIVQELSGRCGDRPRSARLTPQFSSLPANSWSDTSRDSNRAVTVLLRNIFELDADVVALDAAA
jgi:hypothetical protein